MRTALRVFSAPRSSSPPTAPARQLIAMWRAPPSHLRCTRAVAAPRALCGGNGEGRGGLCSGPSRRSRGLGERPAWVVMHGATRCAGGLWPAPPGWSWPRDSGAWREGEGGWCWVRSARCTMPAVPAHAHTGAPGRHPNPPTRRGAGARAHRAPPAATSTSRSPAATDASPPRSPCRSLRPCRPAPPWHHASRWGSSSGRRRACSGRRRRWPRCGRGRGRVSGCGGGGGRGASPKRPHKDEGGRRNGGWRG